MDYPFLSLTDDEGNEFELEYIDTLEYEGRRYMAFLPPEEPGVEPDDYDYGYILLRVEEQPDGEEMLLTIDNEEELEAVYALLLEAFEEAEALDDEDE